MLLACPRQYLDAVCSAIYWLNLDQNPSFPGRDLLMLHEFWVRLFEKSVMNNLSQRLSSLNTEVIVSIVVYTCGATAQLVFCLLHQRASLKTQGI